MKKEKLMNQFTINVSDAYKDMINKLADAYDRKPSELLRLLLLPAIDNQYMQLNLQQHPEDLVFTKI